MFRVPESSYRRHTYAETKDLDGLNYLAGQTVEFVNQNAMKGTILAHTDGNVPNLLI